MAKDQYKIDKNVPVAQATRGSKLKYPWDKMEVGDSIFVNAEQNPISARHAAYVYGRRHKRVFTGTMSDEGIRIWRVA